jgi:hypothetical protein
VADLQSKVTRRPRSKLERVLEILQPTCPVPERPKEGIVGAVIRSYLMEAGAKDMGVVPEIDSDIRAGRVQPALVERSVGAAQIDATVLALKALAKLSLDGLEKLCKLDVEEAKRRLATLPRFDAERVDWVMLASRHDASVAPSPGALRVAARLGYPGSNYAAIARALDAEIPEGDSNDVAWRAHHVLQGHAERTCHRAAPACDRCGVRASCSYRGADADPARRLPVSEA